VLVMAIHQEKPVGRLYWGGGGSYKLQHGWGKGTKATLSHYSDTSANE
jgi:hypothetical protein